MRRRGHAVSQRITTPCDDRANALHGIPDLISSTFKLRASMQVRYWHIASVRCDATIRPESGAKQKWLAHIRSDAIDPDVWSGRAVQEVSSILAMRSCINVSGL
jgi:hypothetical protein